MDHRQEISTITSLFIGSVASLLLSLILPRIIGYSNDLAGAAAATLTFAALYILSLSLSLYLLGITLLGLKRMNLGQRVMGILPTLLVMLVGAVLFSMLR
ncbi:MAG: hypothetical protein ABW092_12095 [Candidatus Thiodiazotropha sp.]